jgi:cyclopropane fatty-acyl-phospholipid synthase-like methyltransferase
MDEKSIKTNWSPNDLPHPFSFYKPILNSDMLHFGYWDTEKEDISLEEAQQSATELLLKQIPEAPARVLDIG